MLKKKRREIRFLKIEMKFRRKGAKQFFPVSESMEREIKNGSWLKYCLRKIYEARRNSPKTCRTFNQNTDLCIGLRKMKREMDYVTLLWAAGDKNLADPWFWNSETDASRAEHARPNERVSYAAHMVIDTRYVAELGGYMACLEEVNLLSTARVQMSLNTFFKDQVQIEENDEAEKNVGHPLEIQVKISSLASRTLEEALEGKRPIGIVAESISEGDGAFDEMFTQRQKEELVLTAKKNTPLTHFIQVINKLRGHSKKYKKYSIKYEEPTKERRTMSFDDVDVQNADLATYAFAQRDVISLNREIGQFSESIHSELEKKMKKCLTIERLALLSKHQ